LAKNIIERKAGFRIAVKAAAGLGKKMDHKYYRIEDVATKTGLTKRALRYYEDIELIKPVRAESLYRLYTEEDIDKVIRIKELKDNLGFSLNEIKDVFELEQDIKSIKKGEKKDKDTLDGIIKAIENQMKLIEEKEEILERVKGKYSEILNNLKSTSQS
jgi:MerR family transcriptional regulator, repressor of the yfmOP operon